MHSPIVYFIHYNDNIDPKHLPLTQALVDDVGEPGYDEFEDMRAVEPAMDYFEYVKEDNPWNIADLFNNDPLFTVVPVPDRDDWLRIDIMKSDLVKREQTIVNAVREYTAIRQKALDNGTIAPTFVNAGDDSIFTEDERDASFKHYDLTSTTGGIVFAELSPHDYNPDTHSVSDTFEGVFISALYKQKVLVDNYANVNQYTTLSLYVPTQIVGDYHY